MGPRGISGRVRKTSPQYGFDQRTERVAISAMLSRHTNNSSNAEAFHSANFWYSNYMTHLRQQFYNKKFVIFPEELFKGFEMLYFSTSATMTHNCSPAASFANCVMTLYPLKVHLQTFLCIPITQKCQILICDTPVANERFL